MPFCGEILWVGVAYGATQQDGQGRKNAKQAPRNADRGRKNKSKERIIEKFGFAVGKDLG